MCRLWPTKRSGNCWQVPDAPHWWVTAFRETNEVYDNTGSAIRLFSIRVRECDRDKTAFTTPLGVYQFKRMSFWLKNAPSTFQRLIDRFHWTCRCHSFRVLRRFDYTDRDFWTAYDWSRSTVSKVRNFKLRINREKSVFACAEVRYLGYLITTNGMQTDPSKTQAIAKLPKPRNVKHLHSFLQMCAWYHFVPRFSDVARSLSAKEECYVEIGWRTKELF